MHLEPIGVSNRLFYYTSGGETSAFDSCFRIDFHEELHQELLISSVTKALQNFPEFALRPVIHEGTVWAVKNDAPVPLIPENAPPLCYGTEETNGYAFAFRALEKGFFFSYFHGMSDFLGTWRFLRTVLYYYAAGKGLAIQADDLIRLAPDASMDELEQIDPYRKFAGESHGADASAAFAIPDETYPPEDAHCTRYEILCPLKEFLATAKAQNTSVSVLLSLTAARALDTLYEVGEKPIVFMVPADMRRYYHTATVMNFSDATFLRYDEELKALPLEKQGAALRGQLKSQLTKEHFAPLIAEKVAAVDGFTGSGTDLFQWNKRFAEPPEKPAAFTVPLTYPGSLDLSAEYRTLVKDITRILYLRGAGSFGILCTTYGDTLRICSVQRFDSPAIMLELRKKLTEEGIPSTFHELPPYQGNQLITRKLKEI